MILKDIVKEIIKKQNKIEKLNRKLITVTTVYIVGESLSKLVERK